MSRKRIYREDYIEYGFTSFMDKGIEKPQCVICLKILCTESMKESKLRDHLNRAHPMLLSKPRQFFERHADMNKIQRLDTPGKECIYDRRDASYASYEVAWLIARNQKPYTIGEQLIKSAAVVMTQLMCGSEQAKKLELIPLSNNTITRRIKDMSIDIKQQLIARVHKSVNFAIQLDETTDIANNAQLMVYVRYQGAQDLEEDILFCQSLDTTTRGIDIFTKTNNFFQDKENQLEWDNCVAVCSDGAPSMLGVHVGFVSYVKEVNPNIIITHCMIHREALVARELQPELHAVMKDVIKIVNYIKSSALNSRLFESLCNDIGSEHVHLLYYSETRWLSRGNVLCRVYELQSEISIFLKEKNHKLARIFTNMEWLSRLFYLVDVFEHLNLLNITLQGRNENLVTVG